MCRTVSLLGRGSLGSVALSAEVIDRFAGRLLEIKTRIETEIAETELERPSALLP